MSETSGPMVSQKEYLKKYLGKKPGDKKKKKKKDRGSSNKITVIDDNIDLDLNVLSKNQEEDEDAPQIVAIIDDRPPCLRVDDKTKESLWIPIAPAADLSSNKPLLKSGFKLTKTEEKNKLIEGNHGHRKSKQTDIRIKEEPLSPARNSSNTSPRSSKDLSPPRRRDHDGDLSPPRKRRNSDSSPPRKNNRADLSPPRKRRNKESRFRDISPVRKRQNPHVAPDLLKAGKSKMVKTLDGKTAGLQNAQELVEEMNEIKDQEQKRFATIPKELSGENASTIFRDKKTGRIRNMEEEYERLKKKQQEDEKSGEKYSKWGRGLVQVENREQQLQEQLKEMSKPLARYADDEDLEKYLKAQEREGDPMLAYLKNKKRKEAAKKGIEEKPTFEGQFMPNRYGIRPGHRWDGVDRSNGYEKKWFQVQNEKIALREESYKWSTEDM